MRFNSDISDVVYASGVIKKMIETEIDKVREIHPGATRVSKNCCTIPFSSIKNRMAATDFIWIGVKAELVSILNNTPVEQLSQKFRNIADNQCLPKTGKIHPIVVDFIKGLIY